MNQLASGRHQCDRTRWRQRGVSDEKEYIRARSVCGQPAERKMQVRHLHTLTLSRKLRWPVTNPPCRSGWIMWQDVMWAESRTHTQRWHSLILFTDVYGHRKVKRGGKTCFIPSELLSGGSLAYKTTPPTPFLLCLRAVLHIGMQSLQTLSQIRPYNPKSQQYLFREVNKFWW